jgi:hypothetical protein
MIKEYLMTSSITTSTQNVVIHPPSCVVKSFTVPMGIWDAYATRDIRLTEANTACANTVEFVLQNSTGFITTQIHGYPVDYAAEPCPGKDHQVNRAADYLQKTYQFDIKKLDICNRLTKAEKMSKSYYEKKDASVYILRRREDDPEQMPEAFASVSLDGMVELTANWKVGPTGFHEEDIAKKNKEQLQKDVTSLVASFANDNVNKICLNDYMGCY